MARGAAGAIGAISGRLSLNLLPAPARCWTEDARSSVRGCRRGGPASLAARAGRRFTAAAKQRSDGLPADGGVTLALPGRGPGLNLNHGYNSLAAATEGPLGYGWTHSYDMSVALDTASGVVTIRQEGGAQLRFYPDGAGGFVASARTVASLVRNANGSWTFKRCGRLTFDFSSSGQLTAITDRNGYATTLQYSAGKLSTVTDSANRRLTFSWTGTRIASVTDSFRSVTFGYDGAGDMTSYTDAGGGTWAFTYGSHRLLTMRRPRFAGVPSPPVTSNVYDASGRVKEQTDELGRKTSFDYTAIPGSTKVTDPKGNVTVEAYNGLIRTSLTRGYGTPEAATWTFQTDGTLGITKVVDPNGGITLASYDRRGNLVWLNTGLRPDLAEGNRPRGLALRTQATYNVLNQPLTVTDASGVTTTYAYDAAGNLQSASTPLVQSPGGTRTTSFGYHPTRPGEVVSITDPAGKVWAQEFDSFGNQISSTDPLGNVTRFGYAIPAKGWLTSTVSPRGVAAGVSTTCTPPAIGCTRFAHDGWGRVTSVTDANGALSTREFDANGNLTKTTDGENNLTAYDYDNADQLVTVDRPGATSLQSSWYPDGTLRSTKDGAGRETLYDYDAQARLISIKDPNNRITRYGYDLAGNPTTRTEPGGSCPATLCTTAAYDFADRLTSLNYSDPATPDITAIGYDSLSRRTELTDGTGTSTWTYDSLGRLRTAKDGANRTLTYDYANLRDPATTITYPGNRPVVRAFDAAGRLTSVKDWLNNTTTFAPDPDANVASVSFPSASALVDSFTYDNAGALDTITNRSAGVVRSSLDYGRADNGQVSSVASTGLPADMHAYTYSPLNQLAGLDAGTYTYDAADNLKTLPTGETLNYDPAHQLTTMARPTGTLTFGYDTRGNRTSATPSTGAASAYGYDQANRLTSVNATSFPSSLAGGWYHSLLVTADGTAKATGYNGLGQLGNNSLTNSATVVVVAGLTSGVTAVAGGAYNSVALKADGTVWTWGWNAVGQLGNGTTTDSKVPVQVSGLTGVTAIAAGGSHVLALRHDGTVWAWGVNDNGQLGDGTQTTRLVPVMVANLSGVVAIAGGYAHSVAVKADGTVWAWGYNGFGQLGDNTTVQRLSPVPVQNLSGVASVVAGWHHSLALKADGSVRAWGYNAQGQLGTGTTTNLLVPPTAAVQSGVRAISAGAYSSFAVMAADAGIRAWGHNANGQLGTGTTIGSLVPIAATGLSGTKGLPITVASHSLAVRSDGTVAAWGYNPYGALGDGSITDRLSPVTVTGYNRGTAPRASYAYNGDGLRTSKTVAGVATSFTWDSSSGLPLLVDDGTTAYIYGPGGVAIEQVTGTTPLWYHADQLGSTRSLTDAAGAVKATATYDPYGRLTTSTGTLSALGFAGEYTDAETGFSYLRARYYDPTTGQFITRDPLESITGEPYGYVGGNPLNFVDPLGLLQFRNPLKWNPLPEIARGVREFAALPLTAVQNFVSSPFNMAWTAAGFFIVRPLAVAALAAAGITSGPALLIGLGVVTVTWFVAGRIVKRLSVDECENQWR